MADYFAGFDTFAYPGDEIMTSLWDNTNLYWCGLYLGPRFNWGPHYNKIAGMGWGVAPIYTGKQPGHSPKLTAIAAAHPGHSAAQREARRKALYENGRGDGTEAIQQARSSGIQPPMVLYFDVEHTPPDANWLVYFKGWCRALVDQGYNAGLYTRSDHAAWVTHQLLTEPGFDTVMPQIWIAKYKRANANGSSVPAQDFLPSPYPTPNPAESWVGATLWQHIGNFGMKWDDPLRPTGHRKFAPVDFNSSIYRNPGMGVLGLLGGQ